MEELQYRFVLPQVKKEAVGEQGEVAEFIPCRLEEGVTTASIRQELERQPHMKALLEALDPERRIYLLEGASLEVLTLAAEYIGTYHRLSNGFQDGWDPVCEGEEDETDWRDTPGANREFDFSSQIPYLGEWEVRQFYQGPDAFGFGSQLYLPNQRVQSRPWWTLSEQAPVVITNAKYNGTGVDIGGSLSNLPGLVRNLSSRNLIILTCCREQNGLDCAFSLEEMEFEPSFTIQDVSFELETDVIHLESPKADGPYKREVLCQLCRERGAPLERPEQAGKILRLLENHRGNTDNATVSKAVSNALIRRKHDGPLTEQDFRYLSAIFTSRKKRAKKKRGAMELVGQQEVRTQLEQIVSSMAFQARRRRLGLEGDAIHYTFAFLGAPGTGKTTWARWLGEEMKKRNLLSNTSSICINAAELKARYVGHTTGKVHALFEQYGIIILDEAYSLTEGEGGDSFGGEALSQLCVELEEHGSDRLVIFAGYGGASDPADNRMLRFLQSNPGISSRISFKIHFSDFQPQELAQVLETMMAYDGYRLPPETAQLAEQFFQRRIGRRAFGNCREVRNLADRIKIHIAVRLAAEKRCSREMASQVRLEDVEKAMEEITREEQGLDRDQGRNIGFC